MNATPAIPAHFAGVGVNALLALLAEEYDAAETILYGMSAAELEWLSHACRELDELIGTVLPVVRRSEVDR